ncbi:transposase [Streptomyces sp. NPDC096105]|uniref:transposase n=1 Tax=Streptomyces sp. NPDC096105 TaxID=3366074 RepID=UPI0038193DAE
MFGGGACGLRTRHSTDLSDQEWEILRPLVPAVKPGGRPAKHARREILNALAQWLRAGCAWRLLPHDLPPVYRSDVYQRTACPLLTSSRTTGWRERT